MRGTLVALEVQGGRWIQRCDVLNAEEAPSAPSGPERRLAAAMP
jgi:hypothetical protein